MADGRLGGLPRHLAIALTGTLTLWVALWSWRGLLELPGSYLGPLLVLAVVVGASGALGRWTRLPGPVVVIAQVAISGVAAAMLIAGTPLPGLDGRPGPVQLFRASVETAQAYAAPVPAEAPGLAPLLIVGGLGLMLLVDLLAGALRRASLAGLPLLAALSLSVSMLGGGVPWVVFALTAAGFLTLLVLQEDEQVDRWGRSLAADERSAVLGRPGTARAGAALIGVAVTALALVVPTGVPSLGLTLLDGPFGSSSADDDIQLDNPMVDLRRDLRRGADVPLVTVRTADPDPRYLRITVLNRFSTNAWSNGDRDLPDEQLADGRVPGLDGVDQGIRGASYDWQIETTDGFDSEWLPTPYPAPRVEAPGNWKYDLATMDFLAASEDLDAASLRYAASRTEIDVTATELAAAQSGATFVSPEYTELPDDLPPLVSDLAAGVTDDQDSAFERAQALQQWFRSDGGFEYTLDRAEGNGGDELVNFLSQGPDGRRGYCEQFASAMAVMARSLGIPSRVAIGFLRPEQVGPGTFEYSAWDLHSWPELYFPGAGWVRFEPTPAGRAPGVPEYTRGDVQLPDQLPGADGVPGDEALPERGADGPNAGAAQEDAAGADDRTGSGDGGTPWVLLAGGLLVLLAVLAAVLPGWWRRRRRDRRWARMPAAVAAWAELRDTTVDLGIGWPVGRSPRGAAEALRPAVASGAGSFPSGSAQAGSAQAGSARAGSAQDASVHEGLDRLVRAIEEEWYSPLPTEPDGASLRADVERCVAAMTAGVPRRRRLRARLVPASLVRRGSPSLAERSLADADRVG